MTAPTTQSLCPLCLLTVRPDSPYREGSQAVHYLCLTFERLRRLRAARPITRPTPGPPSTASPGAVTTTRIASRGGRAGSRRTSTQADGKARASRDD